MTLKLNGSSSGSVSIDAPASTTGGADITFNLPVADGSSGQALTTNASGQLAFSTVAGGKVLQVVYDTAITDVTTSGGSENEVIDATITPAATSSKIFVLGYAALDINQSGSAYANVKLWRGDTSGTEIVRALAGINAGSDVVHTLTPWVLDSPNTTSAQEYTMSISRGSGSTSNVSTSGSTNYHIILVELGA